MMDDGSPDARPDRTVLQIFITFLKIGLTSFGGSTQALVYREVVEKWRWIDDEGFLAGLAIAQVLPGANPVNLALYLGLKVRGGLGASAAVFGMVLPAFVIIMAMGFAYRALSVYPMTHFVLVGMAAAGVGATVSVGYKVATKMHRHVVPIVIAVAVFAAVGLAQWPLVPVVVVAVPLSVAAAYALDRRARDV